MASENSQKTLLIIKAVNKFLNWNAWDWASGKETWQWTTSANVEITRVGWDMFVMLMWWCEKKRRYCRTWGQVGGWMPRGPIQILADFYCGRWGNLGPGLCHSTHFGSAGDASTRVRCCCCNRTESMCWIHARTAPVLSHETLTFYFS